MTRRPLLHATVLALAGLALAACGAAGLTLAVPDLTIPADSTAGSVCYARGGSYWLGVSLDAGFSLGGERSITFEEGRVRVRF
ncbi:MAG: hypothetical protein EA416_17370 [Trueperaceae bacterium]|nr:MAG: hypothetical protein EA416_17370 [Trueperaceae bacterium]